MIVASINITPERMAINGWRHEVGRIHEYIVTNSSDGSVLRYSNVATLKLTQYIQPVYQKWEAQVGLR